VHRRRRVNRCWNRPGPEVRRIPRTDISRPGIPEEDSSAALLSIALLPPAQSGADYALTESTTWATSRPSTSRRGRDRPPVRWTRKVGIASLY
jgi:hypothetical protein